MLVQPALHPHLNSYETKQADTVKICVVNLPRELKISRKEKEKRITNLMVLLERLWPGIKGQGKFNLQGSFYSRILCL